MEIDGESNTNKQLVADGVGGDVDYTGSNHDTNGLESGVSHLQVQEQQLIPTLTNGVSVGVQSDRVAELAPETAVLSLAGKNVNHACWNPSLHTLLATGGKALGRIWTVPRKDSRSGSDPPATNSASATSSSLRSIAVVPDNVVDLNVDTSSTVISLAWSPDGEKIAYSTISDDPHSQKRNSVSVWTRHGSKLDDFANGSEPVTNLTWSWNGRYLAGLSGKSVVAFDIKTGSLIQHLETQSVLLDIIWLYSNQLVICGEGLIQCIQLFENKMTPQGDLSEMAASHDWTRLKFSPDGNVVAFISDSSCQLAISGLSTHLQQITAHNSTITDLAFQPVTGDRREATDRPVLLATCSMDGTVKLWNIKPGINLLRTLEIGGSSPVLSLAFTPDGHCLSAATWDRILFWDIREGGLPRAKWESRRVDWHSALLNGNSHVNGVNGFEHDVHMEDDDDQPPILGWETSGQKLVFAHKDKVSLICKKHQFLGEKSQLT
jgi:WD40 repeat protein